MKKNLLTHPSVERKASGEARKGGLKTKLEEAEMGSMGSAGGSGKARTKTPTRLSLENSSRKFPISGRKITVWEWLQSKSLDGAGPFSTFGSRADVWIDLGLGIIRVGP